MNPERQRIVIAEACGWKHIKVFSHYSDRIVIGFPPGKKERKRAHESQCDPEIPNYLQDLNAMHQALSKLDEWDFGAIFDNHLFKIMIKRLKDSGVSTFERTRAPANELAEAFIKTIGKWEVESTL